MHNDDQILQPYSEFQPTGFDARGLACDDQQDWLVCPVSITRDTPECALEASNFAVMQQILDKLDPDFEDHEVHRFGHWGPGWFEIILVRPDTACAKEAEECAGALENYPVLDDSDFSEREFNWACQEWEGLTLMDQLKICNDAGVDFEAICHCDAEEDEDCECEGVEMMPDRLAWEIHGDGSITWVRN